MHDKLWHVDKGIFVIIIIIPTEKARIRLSYFISFKNHPVHCVSLMFHKCGCPLLVTHKTPHFLSAVQGDLSRTTSELWRAHGDPDQTRIWKQSCVLLQGWLIRPGETLIEFLSLKRCLNTLEPSDCSNPLRGAVWHTLTKSWGHNDSHFQIALYNQIKIDTERVKPAQKADKKFFIFNSCFFCIVQWMSQSSFGEI